MIRDSALAVSGLLVEKVGGPPVKPYQPAGLWQELTSFVEVQHLRRGHGEGLYRRSMYTLLAAHHSAALHDQLRFADSGNLHRPGEPDQHTAAGAWADERSHVSRSGPQTRRDALFTNPQPPEARVRTCSFASRQTARTRPKRSRCSTALNKFERYYENNRNKRKRFLPQPEVSYRRHIAEANPGSNTADIAV